MSYKTPLGSTTAFGLLKVGSGLSASSGIVSTAAESFGAFTDSTTQTNPVINTANNTAYNTTQSSNNVSIVSGNQITFAEAGNYILNASFQISKTDGGNDTISLWLAQNGVNQANSDVEITLDTTALTGYRSITWFVTALAGDFVQVKWSSADIAMRFLATAAQVTPTRPASPSVRLVVHKI